MSPCVVLLSGGVDSSTLLHEVASSEGVDSIHALSFKYGQKHVRELEAARCQAKAVGVKTHRVVDVGVFGQLTHGGSALTDASIQVPDLDAIADSDRAQPPTYVPNRNMMLLAMAAAYAESNDAQVVYYGAQAQDEYGYWDCTMSFLTGINALLSQNRGAPVEVRAPFVEWSKAEIIARGLRLGVDFKQTWTCYRGGATPCGTCPSCVERAGAFAGAGAPDPLLD